MALLWRFCSTIIVADILGISDIRNKNLDSIGKITFWYIYPLKKISKQDKRAKCLIIYSSRGISQVSYLIGNILGEDWQNKMQPNKYVVVGDTMLLDIQAEISHMSVLFRCLVTCISLSRHEGGCIN